MIFNNTLSFSSKVSVSFQEISLSHCNIARGHKHTVLCICEWFYCSIYALSKNWDPSTFKGSDRFSGIKILDFTGSKLVRVLGYNNVEVIVQVRV